MFTRMKKLILSLLAAGAVCGAVADDVILPAPDTERGLPLMQAMAQRRSVRSFADRDLTDRDLSDLLWATMGQNRPDGKRTAPSCRDFREIRLFVFTRDGVGEYIPATHTIRHLVDGDHRALVASGQAFAATAPVCLVMAADMTKFGNTDERSLMMAAVDAGIVSENASVACAGRGLATVPRATMDAAAITSLLNLPATCLPIMNNPVGYPQ